MSRPKFPLYRGVLWFVFIVLLVTLCYLVVDQWVANFVFEHQFSRLEILRWLTYPPPILQTWSPLLLTILVVRGIIKPLNRWEKALVAGALGMIIADQFRESLSYVFGRYWPETWIDNNPSWIQDHAYGFHFFHTGSAYGSFPSGHAARMGAPGAVLWLVFPGLRLVAVILVLITGLSLIGMNYHFVSDVIAGTGLGWMVGYACVWFMGLSLGKENMIVTRSIAQVTE